ncbi:hypothetical protein FPOA_04110 [Fusarium poae]|uniref:Uncharacterized protein n=1 Tax=Fusarium poae TaxID=36050 RepID=A0A1B8ASU8_FUSPO|nr:hypothetical protein FPOA_04110 [Fusarium poae]
MVTNLSKDPYLTEFSRGGPSLLVAEHVSAPKRMPGSGRMSTRSPPHTNFRPSFFSTKTFTSPSSFLSLPTTQKQSTIKSRALSSPSGGSLRRCSSFSPRPAWVEMILVTSKCQYLSLQSVFPTMHGFISKM